MGSSLLDVYSLVDVSLSHYTRMPCILLGIALPVSLCIALFRYIHTLIIFLCIVVFSRFLVLLNPSFRIIYMVVQKLVNSVEKLEHFRVSLVKRTNFVIACRGVFLVCICKKNDEEYCFKGLLFA